MTPAAKPREHTTHFDDCGCQSAALRAEAERWKEVATALRQHVEHDMDCMGDAVTIGPAGVEAILARGDDPNEMPQPCTCGLGPALARFDAMGKEAGDAHSAE